MTYDADYNTGWMADCSEVDDEDRSDDVSPTALYIGKSKLTEKKNKFMKKQDVDTSGRV